MRVGDFTRDTPSHIQYLEVVKGSCAFSDSSVMIRRMTTIPESPIHSWACSSFWAWDKCSGSNSLSPHAYLCNETDSLQLSSAAEKNEKALEHSPVNVELRNILTTFDFSLGRSLNRPLKMFISLAKSIVQLEFYLSSIDLCGKCTFSDGGWYCEYKILFFYKLYIRDFK